MRPLLTCLAAAAVFLCLTSPALADPVNLLVDDVNGTLGYVNLSTGAVTLLGNSGVGLTDIAFSPTGTLYGVDYSNLYTISTSTGQATLVGSLGGTNGYANSLVFSSNGTLSLAGSDLYTINTASGHATDVGSIGYSSGGDLAFVNGQLDLATTADQLVSVDTATGKGSLIGYLGVPNIYGLASPDGVSLYGVADTSVYSINPDTGAATFLLNYGGQGLSGAYGESFYTEAQAVTPEPSSLLLLGSGLLSAPFLRRRLARSRAN